MAVMSNDHKSHLQCASVYNITGRLDFDDLDIKFS